MMDNSPHLDANPTASGHQDHPSHADTNTAATHGSIDPSRRTPARKNKLHYSNQPCRYFATKKGCKAGSQCHYSHVHPEAGSISTESGNIPLESAWALNRAGPETITPELSPPESRQKVAATRNRTVPKPVSRTEIENPREFQISQVVRRYSPFRADLTDATILKFKLIPTDPDFPFELAALDCALSVPSGYPPDSRPTLGVQNLPRKFAINLERGFEALVSQFPGKSLLSLLSELDKNLEKFLSQRAATTVKLISNKQTEGPSLVRTPEPIEVKSVPFVPAVYRYSAAQLQQAKARRDIEVRQLEARLGRSEFFLKADDGVAFNIPLSIPDSAHVPLSLRSLRETALVVPEVYPLEPCTVILKGVEGRDAENVEVAFEKRAVEKSDLSLMAHVNWLSQNLAKLAIDPNPAPTVVLDDGPGAEEVQSASDRDRQNTQHRLDPTRPHVRYVPQPPEWDEKLDAISDETTDSSDDDDTSARESDDEDESVAGGASLPSIATSSVEKGIQLSFPGLSMTNIDLLHINKLSLSVRCDRCKDTADVKDLIATKDTILNTQSSEGCHKCGAIYKLSYRPDFMHGTSSKAGYIDAEGCLVVDLLPSVFQPTCSVCSTIFPSPPGITAVRGDTRLEVCRSCHGKMSFTIPEIKFLRVSTTASGASLLRFKKPKENLGISAGTPLPAFGVCSHYRRSFRWMRFTNCCGRVFPCDQCHNSPSINPNQKDNPHPNEHADRMICGFCSREQRYHPDTCRHCGRSVVKRSVTTGFWEGGKGTREKHLMRKKEGRKYKVSGREKKELNKKKVDGKGKGGMWWPE